MVTTLLDCQTILRISHHKPCRLRNYAVDVCSRLHAFHERVAVLQKCELGCRTGQPIDSRGWKYSVDAVVLGRIRWQVRNMSLMWNLR
jgi:hypothetical protein